MPRPGWLDEVRRVLERVIASDATEVELERRGLRIRIKRRPDLSAPDTSPGTDAGPSSDSGDAILAPLTGVFFRASSPGAGPYVKEGDTVQPDTVVGLIETMKVFNEVVAERHGRVRKFLVSSGQLVQAGDRLLIVDPTDAQSGAPGQP